MLDLEKATFEDVLQSISENYIAYSDNYNLYTYYHYDSNNVLGVVYGWFIDNCLYIDVVFVKEEERGKNIATCMLENVLQEMRLKKDVEFIIIELVQYKGKYLLVNILSRLGFCFDKYSYVCKNKCIFYKLINEK